MSHPMPSSSTGEAQPSTPQAPPDPARWYLDFWVYDAPVNLAIPELLIGLRSQIEDRYSRREFRIEPSPPSERHLLVRAVVRTEDWPQDEEKEHETLHEHLTDILDRLKLTLPLDVWWCDKRKDLRWSIEFPPPVHDSDIDQDPDLCNLLLILHPRIPETQTRVEPVPNDRSTMVKWVGDIRLWGPLPVVDRSIL
ncbi:uncharacterized protein BO72DRAFT_460026 [Aspergillus fijiensis CBS 313.89]|uniref:Uncharacterized protein n=1 Tax=Aspergillus fijiensis CBS 313.89 TaxID=1448319 RepID=A0A8G1RNH5_9EURO|nr:uncharacterized protein BO72DRAFT_460026 [Aspergillus fijiensis CBS 313.89]RAK75883.1 hypothetical protein BO72DRAFT_460026 [Aspergillus fijiensis CBS 313.89]